MDDYNKELDTFTTNNPNIQIEDGRNEEIIETVNPLGREKTFKAETLVSIDKIEPKYRHVFSNYMYFNRIQSSVFNSVLDTDDSLVVSAPTGSGKTVIFELAIIKYLSKLESLGSDNNYKIIYVAPMKALCEERLVDWHRKFNPIGVSCVSATGDSENISFSSLLSNNLIITTPEKWDSLTRHWRNHTKFVKTVGLFMIDEVHLLNDESRGPTLEAIVSRMKTIQACMNSAENDIRFLAVSATIPNVEDIAEWIGSRFKPAKFYSFDEETRPVKLTKIVLGYQFNPQMSTPFKFDIMLSYKLQNVILQYSNGKPTLIFCSTRKSVEMTAKYLVQNLSINLSQVQKGKLQGAAFKVSEVFVKETLVHGVGCHHAGMLPENRFLIEQLFRNSELPILVTTSTLAMGVNLPAHLVIIKSTKQYIKGEYKDYSESALLQMIGRAGRPQFDRTATAVILTTSIDKSKFENMICGIHPVESSLHKHLAEHLNAEVVLRTITDLGVAMQWLTSSFLYIRARRHPKYYGLPIGLMPDQIDKKLLDICQIEINKLAKSGMITIDFNINILPTQIGTLMAQYYVHFETMKLFKEVTGKECLRQILGIISRCHEYSDMCLRGNDKKALNLLNKCKTRQTIRFPLIGKIKTLDMKINCIIQAVFGCLEILEPSLLTEAQKIMRIGERLANCLAEYLVLQSKCYSALLNALLLAKCFHIRIWENSPYVSRQLVGIGAVMSANLVAAGKTTFDSILNSNPRNLELIIHRKSPMGNTIQEQVAHLPQYEMSFEGTKLSPISFKVKLVLRLKNYKMLESQLTLNPDSVMNLLIGDGDNNVILFEKYSHTYMVENPYICKELDVECDPNTILKAHFISENWVGIDCDSTFSFSTFTNDKSKSNPTEKELQNTEKDVKIKERPKVNKKFKEFVQPNSSDKPYAKKFIDQYFKITKKASGNIVSDSVKVPLAETFSSVNSEVSEKHCESENEANLLKGEDSGSTIEEEEEEDLDLEEKLLESSDTEIETEVVEAEKEPENENIKTLIRNSTTEYSKICNKDICPESRLKLISDIVISKGKETEKKKSIDKFIEAKVQEMAEKKSIDSYQQARVKETVKNNFMDRYGQENVKTKNTEEVSFNDKVNFCNVFIPNNKKNWESENTQKKNNEDKNFSTDFKSSNFCLDSQCNRKINVETSFIDLNKSMANNCQNQSYSSKIYSNPSWMENSEGMKSEYQNVQFDNFEEYECIPKHKNGNYVFSQIPVNNISLNTSRIFSTPKIYTGTPKRKLVNNKYAITNKSTAFEDYLYQTDDSNSPTKLNIKQTFSYTPKKKLPSSKFDASSIKTEPDSTNSSEYHVLEVLTPKRSKLENNQESYQLSTDKDGKKSITWSSPLVTSPGMKYSPKTINVLYRNPTECNFKLNNNLEFPMESNQNTQPEDIKPSSSNRKNNSKNSAKYSNFPLRSRKNIVNLPITDKECSYSQKGVQSNINPFEKFNDILSTTLIETLHSNFNAKEIVPPKTAERKEVKVIEQDITSYVVDTQRKKSFAAATSSAPEKNKSDNCNLSIDLNDFFNDDFPEIQLTEAAKDTETQNFEGYNEKMNSVDAMNAKEFSEFDKLKSVSECSSTNYGDNRIYPEQTYSDNHINNFATYTPNFPNQNVSSDNQLNETHQNYEMPSNKQYYGNISAHKDYSGFYDQYNLPTPRTAYPNYHEVDPYNYHRKQNYYNYKRDMFSSDPYAPFDKIQEGFPKNNWNQNFIEERFAQGPPHNSIFVPNNFNSTHYGDISRDFPINMANNLNNRYHIVEGKSMINSGRTNDAPFGHPPNNVWSEFEFDNQKRNEKEHSEQSIPVYEYQRIFPKETQPSNAQEDRRRFQINSALSVDRQRNPQFESNSEISPRDKIQRSLYPDQITERSNFINQGRHQTANENIIQSNYNSNLNVNKVGPEQSRVISNRFDGIDDSMRCGNYNFQNRPLYPIQPQFGFGEFLNHPNSQMGYNRAFDKRFVMTLSVDRQRNPQFESNSEISPRDKIQRSLYPDQITERSNFINQGRHQTANENIIQSNYNSNLNVNKVGPEQSRVISNRFDGIDDSMRCGNYNFQNRPLYPIQPQFGFGEFLNHPNSQMGYNRAFDKRFVMSKFFDS